LPDPQRGFSGAFFFPSLLLDARPPRPRVSELVFLNGAVSVSSLHYWRLHGAVSCLEWARCVPFSDDSCAGPAIAYLALKKGQFRCVLSPHGASATFFNGADFTLVDVRPHLPFRSLVFARRKIRSVEHGCTGSLFLTPFLFLPFQTLFSCREYLWRFPPAMLPKR